MPLKLAASHPFQSNGGTLQGRLSSFPATFQGLQAGKLGPFEPDLGTPQLEIEAAISQILRRYELTAARFCNLYRHARFSSPKGTDVQPAS